MQENKEKWEDVSTDSLPAPWRKDLSNFTQANFPALKEEGMLQRCLKEFKENENVKDGSLLETLLAVEMFVESMKWRQRMRVDHILEEFPKSPYFPLLRKYWPCSITDSQENRPKFLRTKEGAPFFIEKLSFVDPNLTDYFPLEVLYRHHLWVNETVDKMRNEILEETGLYCGLVVIEASLSQVANSKLLSVLESYGKVDTENYPEALRKVYLVNATKTFSYIWSIINYFFDEGTKKKFFFSEIGKLPKEIAEVIHPKSLPRQYGGVIEWNVGPAGKVKDYNLTFPEPDTKKESKWEKQLVKYNHEIHLEVQQNWTIVWEFATKDYDIGFGLKYKEHKDHDEHHEILKVERIDSYKSAVYGLHTAIKTGIYILHWDNTYSYTKNKDLKYKVKVKDEKGESQYPLKEEEKSKKSKTKEKK